MFLRRPSKVRKKSCQVRDIKYKDCLLFGEKIAQRKISHILIRRVQKISKVQIFERFLQGLKKKVKRGFSYGKKLDIWNVKLDESQLQWKMVRFW